MKTAVLLIAHGSRNPDANADLVHWADALSQRGEYAIVEPAFLELTQPDIPTGAQRCVEQGAERVILVPYFLAPGVHARQDLLAFRDRFGRENPGVSFVLAEPLGRHPLLGEVINQRILEALEGLGPAEM